MALTRERAQEVLATYIEAWETQDPELICTIFTENATYHERVLRDPIPDREAIRKYWETKVGRDQANIRCHLITFYVDPGRDTLIAEWDAWFDDVAQGVRKHMREIAVMEFCGPWVVSLREYWASEHVGELEPRA